MLTQSLTPDINARSTTSNDDEVIFLIVALLTVEKAFACYPQLAAAIGIPLALLFTLSLPLFAVRAVAPFLYRCLRDGARQILRQYQQRRS